MRNGHEKCRGPGGELRKSNGKTTDATWGLLGNGSAQRVIVMVLSGEAGSAARHGRRYDTWWKMLGMMKDVRRDGRLRCNGQIGVAKLTSIWP